MHYDWNPFKIDDGESIRHHEKAWNFDERNESYYLGKINQAGESDPTCVISQMEKPAATTAKEKLLSGKKTRMSKNLFVITLSKEKGKGISVSGRLPEEKKIDFLCDSLQKILSVNEQINRISVLLFIKFDKQEEIYFN